MTFIFLSLVDKLSISVALSEWNNKLHDVVVLLRDVHIQSRLGVNISTGSFRSENCRISHLDRIPTKLNNSQAQNLAVKPVSLFMEAGKLLRNWAEFAQLWDH